MATDVTQVRVGVTGRILVAPSGTAFPTGSTTSFPAGWADLGFVDIAGPMMTPKPTFKDIFAWQQLYPVRTLKTQETTEWKFKIIQTTGSMLKLAFGGGTITSLGGGDYQFSPPVPGTIDERSVGIEVVDGTLQTRYLLHRGIVTATSAVNFKRDQAIDYEVAITALGVSSGDVWNVLSNDPAMAA